MLKLNQEVSAVEKVTKKEYVVKTKQGEKYVAPISSTKRNYPSYVAIDPSFGMKTSGKVLLDQLTTIDYEARRCVFLEETQGRLLDELLPKVRTVFQKANEKK